MSKNYKLLTTAIVSALNRSEPTPRGAVWTPVQIIDAQEAEALVRLGYAEQTTKEATHFAPGERKQKLSGITVDAIKQPDGTYKNGNDIRVNEDGSEYVPTDAEREKAEVDAAFTAFLARPTDQVIKDVHGLNEAQAAVLTDMETAGKNRIKVLAAFADVSDED